MHHAEKNKNVIYRLGQSVLEKYFVSVSKTSLGPRQNIFPVRTSHPVNNIYIYILMITLLRISIMLKKHGKA